MKNLLFLLSLFVLLSSGSCKKETHESPSDKVEVKKDSKQWPGTKSEASLAMDNQLTVFLFGEGEEYIAISFAKPTQTGDISEFSAAYFRLLGGDVIIDEQLLDKTKPYHLEITAFNTETRQVAGKFSFTLKRNDWFTESLGTQSHEFTGQFNIGYTTYSN